MKLEIPIQFEPQPTHYYDCLYCEMYEIPCQECIDSHYTAEEAAKFYFRLLKPEIRQVVQIT